MAAYVPCHPFRDDGGEAGIWTAVFRFRISVMAFRFPCAGFSPAFFEKPDIRDRHSPVDSFEHVVDRQKAGLDGGERFHFHTGFADAFRSCLANNTVFGRDEIDGYPGKCDGMAKRDQVGCPFGSHDGCDSGNA